MLPGSVSIVKVQGRSHGTHYPAVLGRLVDAGCLDDGEASGRKSSIGGHAVLLGMS